jgi:uncharacterized membrane protein YphA (DoxX/SURF4 family)
MTLNDIAWLAFRAGFSIVFLNAAWQCGKNQGGITWTIDESRILFGDAARVFGPAGIVVMGAGGLAILLGVGAELAGIVLTVFLLMGAVIHLRHSEEAVRLAAEVRGNTVASEPLRHLAVSCQLGHYSSAMKNYSLCGPALFFAIMGSGNCSIVRLWGLAGA